MLVLSNKNLTDLFFKVHTMQFFNFYNNGSKSECNRMKNPTHDYYCHDLRS